MFGAPCAKEIHYWEQSSVTIGHVIAPKLHKSKWLLGSPPLCDACFGVHGIIATFGHGIGYTYSLHHMVRYVALRHNARLQIVIGDIIGCEITQHEGLRFRHGAQHVTRFGFGSYIVQVTPFHVCGTPSCVNFF